MNIYVILAYFVFIADGLYKKGTKQKPEYCHNWTMVITHNHSSQSNNILYTNKEYVPDKVNKAYQK